LKATIATFLSLGMLASIMAVLMEFHLTRHLLKPWGPPIVFGTIFLGTYLMWKAIGWFVEWRDPKRKRGGLYRYIYRPKRD
jgi:hypothetical protein